jgi:hypothetical protein
MRFTIRDLLWLTVVAVMGAAWWLDRLALTRERASLQVEREVLRAEQLALQAKRRELDVQFLRLVEATDQLNNARQRETKPQTTGDDSPRFFLPLYYPPDPNAL